MQTTGHTDSHRFLIYGTLIFLLNGVSFRSLAASGEDAEFAVRFLKTYCFDCHSADDDQRLDLSAIEPDVGGEHLEVWQLILEQLRFREMPPSDAPQPSLSERGAIIRWIRTESQTHQWPGSFLHESLKNDPENGNYVDHDTLFNEHPGPVIPAPPRVWRIRPEIYDRMFSHTTTGSGRLPPPFSHSLGRHFKDFAQSSTTDEAAAEQLLNNAEAIVNARFQTILQRLTAAVIFSSAPDKRTDVTTDIETDFLVDEEAFRKCLDAAYSEVLHRKPNASEVGASSEFYRQLLRSVSPKVAARRVLMAVVMKPEVIFREELGTVKANGDLRRRLSQRETAIAVSFALGDEPDQILTAAADRGELETNLQLRQHVEKRLKQRPLCDHNPRVLQFFREYFDYGAALNVFKNPPQIGVHDAQMLTTDLELLIEHVLERDEQVLFTLLTTNEYFVDCMRSENDHRLVQRSVTMTGAARPDSAHSAETGSIYGLPRDWIWTPDQPVRISKHMRAGVLTHPAWLVAWSGNFNNHPVQRGLWIRTRLLGGTVPDIPIDVDATIPEDRQQQFRERLLTATADTRCQKCHRKMDPLGLPFEQFDHYGRYRVREIKRPLDVSGRISFVNDDSLSGDVSNPIELLHRLAGSDHVEQVFVRHVFRFFMGRNETLGDAASLQNAWQVYKKTGGSFKALVKSLLLSDSFLYRMPAEDRD